MACARGASLDGHVPPCDYRCLCHALRTAAGRWFVSGPARVRRPVARARLRFLSPRRRGFYRSPVPAAGRFFSGIQGTSCATVFFFGLLCFAYAPPGRFAVSRPSPVASSSMSSFSRPSGFYVACSRAVFSLIIPGRF